MLTYAWSVKTIVPCIGPNKRLFWLRQKLVTSEGDKKISIDHTLARLLISIVHVIPATSLPTFSMAAIVFECDPFSMVNEGET